jgi:hypothetical protein
MIWMSSKATTVAYAVSGYHVSHRGNVEITMEQPIWDVPWRVDQDPSFVNAAVYILLIGCANCICDKYTPTPPTGVNSYRTRYETLHILKSTLVG